MLKRNKLKSSNLGKTVTGIFKNYSTYGISLIPDRLKEKISEWKERQTKNKAQGDQLHLFWGEKSTACAHDPLVTVPVDDSLLRSLSPLLGNWYWGQHSCSIPRKASQGSGPPPSPRIAPSDSGHSFLRKYTYKKRSPLGPSLPTSVSV